YRPICIPPVFHCIGLATPALSTLSLHDALPIYRRMLDGVIVAILNVMLAIPGLVLLLALISFLAPPGEASPTKQTVWATIALAIDRKSTRLNSSHVKISYAVFCLKKKRMLGHDL